LVIGGIYEQVGKSYGNESEKISTQTLLIIWLAVYTARKKTFASFNWTRQTHSKTGSI